MRPLSITRPLGVLLTTLGATLSAPAHAFSEDLCWNFVNRSAGSGPIVPKPFNCWDMQCQDKADEAKRPGACVITGLATLADATLENLHARNSLHFDVTYLLARLQGMRLEDARKLAVYNEATDLGAYQHYDHSGVRVVDQSVDLLGVRRTNLTTNGFWLHFVPWYRGATSATESLVTYTEGTGVHAPFPASERPLNHLRAWAFGQQGELCEFGLTEGSDVTGACHGTTRSTTLYWDVPLLSGPHDRVDVRQRKPVPLQWQRIKRVDGASDDCTDRDTCFERSYSSHHASIESLGIYLHALGDRLSHHHCSDGAAIADTWHGEGTPTSSADLYLFYPDICGTAAHVALHYPETGHELVPERTREAVRMALLEIGQWMQSTGYASSNAASPRTGFPALSDTSALVARIVQATSEGTAAQRLSALCQLARDGYGVDWHDGNASCVYEAGNAGAASGTSQTQAVRERAGTLSASDGGNVHNLSMTARVVPSGEDTGEAGKVYLGARLANNQWFFLTPAGFVPWLSGEPTPYFSGTLDVLTIPILDGSLDLAALRGTDIYLGYGRNLGDMLQRGTIGRVGTIPKLGTASGQ